MQSSSFMLSICLLLPALLWSASVCALLLRPDMPPRGWNSYDAFGCSNESTTIQVAEIMADKLLPYGYEYLTIDAGWFGSMDQPTVDDYGRLVPSSSLYPSASGSFKSLAGVVHALGLKFGLWMMFGIPKVAVDQKLPIKGTHYTADEIALDASTTCPWAQNFTYSVNTTHPGGKAYYKSLVELYEEWGVDLLKMDCSFAEDMTQQHYEDVKEFSTNLQHSNNSFLLSMSPGGQTNETAIKLIRPLATMARITNDFWDVFSGPPDTYPSSVVSHFQVAYRFQDVKRDGFYLDFDMLPFGRIGHDGGDCKSVVGCPRQSALTLTEQQMVMTFWAMSKSPLIHGGDLTVAEGEDLEVLLNTDILDTQTYIDGFSMRFLNVSTNVQVWSGKNADPSQGDHAYYLAVFNLGSQSARLDMPYTKFGFSSGNYSLVDMWTGVPVSYSTHYSATVNARSGFAYKATFIDV